jgi:pyruvate dehydrogenase E1 component beta subunit
LIEEMDRDNNVILIGEDIAVLGGAYRVTEGLLDRYGEERVMDAPISENAIIGAGVGAAMTGLRPVVEIQFNDFLTCAMDQICNQAAKIRFMMGGQVNVPMVIRCPVGATGRAAQHSQSLEAWFLHTPGLKIAMPSNPHDAKGLLKTAIRDNNPVLFFEHKMLYGAQSTGGKAKSAIDGIGDSYISASDDDYTIPFGEAVIRRKGTAVTIVATLLMVYKSLEAAQILSNEGIEVEIIDPRTLVPLDEDTIINSVKKTGRLVIVTEDVSRCGVGAEISAIIAEKALYYLDAPIMRVAVQNTPIPFSPGCEDHAVPNVAEIVRVIRLLVKGR